MLASLYFLILAVFLMVLNGMIRRSRVAKFITYWGIWIFLGISVSFAVHNGFAS